jgi:hypothetical protein
MKLPPFPAVSERVVDILPRDVPTAVLFVPCLLGTLYLAWRSRAAKRTIDVHSRIAQLEESIAAHSTHEKTMHQNVMRSLSEVIKATALVCATAL